MIKINFFTSLFAFVFGMWIGSLIFHTFLYSVILASPAFCSGYLAKYLNCRSKWVDIDSELPEEMDIVLFKFTIDGYSDPEYRSTGYVLDKIPILDFDRVDIDRMEVTHWKKIN